MNGFQTALAAKEAGAERILIVERDKELGGILNQCIHNGFGLHTFQEELTGPEYAARYIEKAEQEKIPFLLETIVIDIAGAAEGEKVVTAMNKERGLFAIRTTAVILAMGCRERPRGALNIPGFRPTGFLFSSTCASVTPSTRFFPLISTTVWLSFSGMSKSSRHCTEAAERSRQMPEAEKGDAACGVCTEAKPRCWEQGTQAVVEAAAGVRYTVPSVINPLRAEDVQRIRFRVDDVYRDDWFPDSH